MRQATLPLSSALSSYLSFLPPISLQGLTRAPQCAKHYSGHCGYNYSYRPYVSAWVPTSWLRGHELKSTDPVLPF